MYTETFSENAYRQIIVIVSIISAQSEVMLMQAQVVAIAILIVAVAFDLATRKVPNWLIVLGYLIGISTMTIKYGWSYIYLIRAIWPVLALFIFYYIKALGAGDIKLFSVLSIFCPTKMMISFIITSFVVAAIYGIVKLLYARELKQKMYTIVNHIFECANKRVYETYKPTNKNSYICFSLSMLLAYVINIGMEVFM